MHIIYVGRAANDEDFVLHEREKEEVKCVEIHYSRNGDTHDAPSVIDDSAIWHAQLRMFAAKRYSHRVYCAYIYSFVCLLFVYTYLWQRTASKCHQFRMPKTFSKRYGTFWLQKHVRLGFEENKNENKYAIRQLMLLWSRPNDHFAARINTEETIPEQFSKNWTFGESNKCSVSDFSSIKTQFVTNQEKEPGKMSSMVSMSPKNTSHQDGLCQITNNIFELFLGLIQLKPIPVKESSFSMNESIMMETSMNTTMIRAKRMKPVYPPHAMRRRSQVFVNTNRRTTTPNTV